MRIFLSYSSKDRALIEPVNFALCAQQHDVFFDRDDLPPGDEYDTRIREAIEKSHLFIFMVSPNSLNPGSYTLTELGIAEKTWRNPAGHVLPVIVRPTGFEQIPGYLKSVTLLDPPGNLAASTVDAAHRIAIAHRKKIAKAFAAWSVALMLIGAAMWTYITHRQLRVITAKDGAPAILISGGNFTMGDDENSPLRQINVDPFYLDQFEVTTARFGKFLQATGALRPPESWEDVDLKESGNLPVVGVDWRDAEAYCKWAGKRLPTEAEWERAARSTDGRTYPWGNDVPTPARASFARTASSAYKDGVSAVGSHASGNSVDGIADLAGNVSEWVADWYSEIFPTDDVRNPHGPEAGNGKVIRGGGWEDPAERIKSTKRSYASVDNRADDIGFRCARDSR